MTHAWTLWIRGLGVVLISAVLLSLTSSVLFPEWTDAYPPPPSSLPGTMLGIAVWVVAIGLGVFDLVLALRRARRRQEELRCGNCGYLLKGLRDPRCPECGTPFDPGLLKDIHPGDPEPEPRP